MVDDLLGQLKRDTPSRTSCDANRSPQKVLWFVHLLLTYYRQSTAIGHAFMKDHKKMQKKKVKKNRMRTEAHKGTKILTIDGQSTYFACKKCKRKITPEPNMLSVCLRDEVIGQNNIECRNEYAATDAKLRTFCRRGRPTVRDQQSNPNQFCLPSQ